MTSSDHVTQEHHLSPDHLRAIGALIVIWSHFEAQMELGVVALSGMTKSAGGIVVNEMSTRDLIRNLKHLVRQKVPERADEFDRILDGDDRNRGLDKIYPVRNLFAHSVFGRGTKDGFIKPIGLRVRDDYVKIQVEEFDVPGIMGYVSLIRERTNRLRSLLKDSGFGFDSIPDHE